MGENYSKKALNFDFCAIFGRTELVKNKGVKKLVIALALRSAVFYDCTATLRWQ